MTKDKEQKSKDGSQKTEGPSISTASVLVDLLSKETELVCKLVEALEAGRYFITVTVQKKYSPDDEHDLHHCYIRKDIMVNDVVPSLKHIASDFIAKENPTAEQPDKTTWH